MRTSFPVLAAAAVACLLAPAARAAHDIPYYKLNYAHYDYTYAWEVEKSRKYSFFYWGGEAYCRYRTGWNGPGAYHVGTRFKRRSGWDGGYPWQGPGAPADHEDPESFAAAKADYAHDFRGAGTCAPRRHHRLRHPVVLRRKY